MHCSKPDLKDELAQLKAAREREWEERGKRAAGKGRAGRDWERPGRRRARDRGGDPVRARGGRAGRGLSSPGHTPEPQSSSPARLTEEGGTDSAPPPRLPSREEPVLSAEDFSDFGDSDDDILNQEEDEAGESAGAGPGSRPGTPGSPAAGRDGVLADLQSDLGEAAVDTEKEETVRSNARLADALGANWAELLGDKKDSQAGDTAAVQGEARRRWTLPEVVRRTGLSRSLLGGETQYRAALELVNSGVKESERVEPLSACPGRHWALRSRAAQRASLFQLGGCRALSARADLAIRRELCGLRGPDLGLQPARPAPANSDLAARYCRPPLLKMFKASNQAFYLLAITYISPGAGPERRCRGS